MSPVLDLAAAEWVKSSYSDASGGNCVEFSRTFTWVKSSYSEAQRRGLPRILPRPHPAPRPRPRP